MRRQGICFIVMLFCFLLPVSVYAADEPIRVFIDDEPLDEAYSSEIIEGRTFVPIRVIAETWGAVVGWNQELQQVRIRKDRLTIDLFIDQYEAIVAGETVVATAAPQVIDGRTMIPLRFVGELLGAQVQYDVSERAVKVFLPKEAQPQQPPIEKPTPELPEVEQVPDGVNTLDVVHLLDHNQVVLQMSASGSANDFYLKDPERIVIDLPQTVFDPSDENHQFDLKTHQASVQAESTSEMIKAVRYSLHDPKAQTVRVVIDLATRADYTIEKKDNSWIITATPGKYKVVLDAGHGGHDPGAKSYSGKSEKWFNLSVAKKIHNALEDETRIEPYLSRADDQFISLQGRTEFANELDADLFMSVHANAYLQSTRGTETYYYHERSKHFGEIAHKRLLEATGFADRKLQRKGFYVVKNTKMPSVLIEVGFLTNPTEEKHLFEEQFQDKVAQAMANAIKEYLGL